MARAAAAALGLAGVSHAGTDDHASFKVTGLVVVWGTDAPGEGNGEPVVSDFVIDTGSGNTAASSGDTDLIADDAFTVITGSLQQFDDGLNAGNGTPLRMQRIPGGGFLTDTNGDDVMDASDSFSAFRIRQNSDLNTRRAEIESSFYVASNVPFRIDAQAFPVGSTTPEQMQRMRVWLSTTLSGDDGIAFGTRAQYPHSAGPTGGSRANGRRLSTMIAPRNVFRGDQRTAALPGSLAEQSVRFDLVYRYNDGPYDLSEGAYDAEAEVIYTVYIP